MCLHPCCSLKYDKIFILDLVYASKSSQNKVVNVIKYQQNTMIRIYKALLRQTSKQTILKILFPICVSKFTALLLMFRRLATWCLQHHIHCGFTSLPVFSFYSSIPVDNMFFKMILCYRIVQSRV